MNEGGKSLLFHFTENSSKKTVFMIKDKKLVSDNLIFRPEMETRDSFPLGWLLNEKAYG